MYFEYLRDSGSLPPPYHYTSRIIIMPDGNGLYEVIPDYEFNHPPHWQEYFQINQNTRTKLLDLFRVVQENRKADTRSENGSRGSGDLVSLRYEIDTDSGEIAADLRMQNNAMTTFLSALQGAIPDRIRQDLLHRRDKYIADYLMGRCTTK
jgi:hypothetical protein